MLHIAFIGTFTIYCYTKYHFQFYDYWYKLHMCLIIYYHKKFRILLLYPNSRTCVTSTSNSWSSFMKIWQLVQNATYGGVRDTHWHVTQWTWWYHE